MTKRRRIMHSLTIKEIAGVDVPAQEGARHLISKRVDDVVAKPDDEDFEKNLDDPRLTSIADGHQHMIDGSDMSGRTSWEKSENEDRDHDHPWLRKLDGTIDIGMAEGHDHTVLEKRKERDMTKKETDKEITKEQLDEVTKRAERAEKFAEMSDAQKAHFEKLADTDKETFLSLDKSGRQKEVEKATASDPVVYTSARSGREYRKSGDPEILEAVKSADEAWDIAKSERELRQDGDLQKRADALGNIPGESDVKKALLRAIDNIKDETLRKGALEIVVSANSGLSKSFERRGTEGGPARGTNGDAEARYEKMAQDFAKTNSCTIERARADVLLTDEGAQVYSEITNPIIAD